MIKKTITYKDFNDVERTEDFYFNLTRAEVAEMELGTAGGYSEMLQHIVQAKDIPSIVKVIKELIKNSYGVKSADGKRFIKKEELFEEFAQTNAYSQLFMELATDADKASAFINGIMPIIPEDLPSENKTPAMLPMA